MSKPKATKILLTDEQVQQLAKLEAQLVKWMSKGETGAMFAQVYPRGKFMKVRVLDERTTIALQALLIAHGIGTEKERVQDDARIERWKAQARGEYA